MNSSNRIRLSAILMSALLLAGGAFIAFATIGQLAVTNLWLVSVVAFAGIVAGGVLSTLTSRRGPLETMLGAVIAFAPFLVIALFDTNDLDTRVATRLLIIGATLAIGAVTGAVLGARLPRPDTHNWVYWALMSGAIVGGSILLLMGIAIPIVGDGIQGVAIYVALFGGLFGGALITQAICPTQRSWLCGCGMIIVLLPVGFAGGFVDPDRFGTPFAGLVFWPLGAIGALVGWHLFGKRNEAAGPQQLADIFD